MCGIIGYFVKGEKKPTDAVFDKAVDALTHRGPDGRGIWKKERVALGFRRLAIIDLKSGGQPMSNEDESLHLVFNGEIYNFKELRAALEQKGRRFKTQSDTETILHLYEEEGENCVKRLRGMFAFAIYDQRQNSLFLARDRFGKKPLVYSETPTGFYFASEMESLLQLADGRRNVDAPALDSYLALGYVPGERTAWREIRRLPAASILWVRKGVPEKPKKYWRLDWDSEKTVSSNEREMFDLFRGKFEEGVRLRMVSDVPLGVFLSGGLDSSVTAAAMTRLGGKVRSFCIGFEEARFDESPYALKVSKILGTDHQVLKVEPDALDELDPLIGKLGEPFADHSLLPAFLLSKFTRQSVTVALSGDGGDELFAGYKRYKHLARAGFLRRWGLAGPWLVASKTFFKIEQLLNPSRRKLEWPRSSVDRIVGLEFLDQYLKLAGCWSAQQRHLLLGKNLEGDWAESFLAQRLKDHSNAKNLKLWQALDCETYLVDDILRKVDAASMSCSLECRSPFLDQETAEWAAKLPKDAKVDWKWRGKMILRKLYPDLLPPDLFLREKKGFSMPIGKWMRKQWREIVRESIEGSWGVGMERVFDRKGLKRIWNEHQEGRQDHGARLWAWLVLFRWNRQFRPVWEG